MTQESPSFEVIFRLDSETIIERYDPWEIKASLRSLVSLTPMQAEKLNLYLDEWTLTMLTRPNDPRGVEEVLSLCELASDIVGHANNLSPRWAAYESLLEGKRLRLQANETRGKASGSLTDYNQQQHQSIMSEVRSSPSGFVTQDYLRVKLQLTPGRISQILSLMEDHGLIHRTRNGKTNEVRLAREALPVENCPRRPTIGLRVFGARSQLS